MTGRKKKEAVLYEFIFHNSSYNHRLNVLKEENSDILWFVLPQIVPDD